MITDAEDLEGREQALKAVKEATKQNIQVDIIGVGSTSPVTIPTANGYFTDENGQVVKTALNEIWRLNWPKPVTACMSMLRQLTH